MITRTKAEARAMGQGIYRTGKPCKYGQHRLALR